MVQAEGGTISAAGHAALPLLLRSEPLAAFLQNSFLLYCSERSQWPSCFQLRGPPLCGPADECFSSMARVLAGKAPRGSDPANITARDRDGERDEEGGSFDCNICYDLAREPVVTLCGWVVVDQWGP